jgi:dethiobiotin synthetase
MLLIKKKFRRNQKSLLRMQNTPRKISLPVNMVVRENLGCKNQCLLLVRNTNPRKNTITGFVNG